MCFEFETKIQGTYNFLEYIDEILLWMDEKILFSQSLENEKKYQFFGIKNVNKLQIHLMCSLIQKKQINQTQTIKHIEIEDGDISIYLLLKCSFLIRK